MSLTDIEGAFGLEVADTTVGWIYKLKKDELQQELTKYGEFTVGTVEELRTRLKNVIRGNKPPTSPKLIVSSPPNTAQPRSPTPNLMQPSPISAVLDQVRKWNINFDGKKDVVSFLERIEELQDGYNFSNEQMLRALPELLKGDALLWYRNNRTFWTTWECFLTSFKSFYLPSEYHFDLEEKVRSRTQRETENVKDYVIAIQTLLRRLNNITPAQQLHRIYTNLKPEYRKYIRRRDFNTLSELVNLANDYELVCKQETASKKQQHQTQTYTPNPGYNTANRNFSINDGNTNATSFNRNTQQTTERQAGYINSAQQSRFTEANNSRQSIIENYNRNTFCWRCGEINHRRFNCNNPQRKFCSRCGRHGIFSRDCNCQNTPNTGNETEAAQTRSRDQRRIEPNTREPNTSYPNQHYPIATQMTNNTTDNRPTLQLTIENRKFEALIDTGSVRSYIGDAVCTLCEINNIKQISCTRKIKLADCSEIEINKEFEINYTAAQKRWTDNFLYMPNLTSDIILGMDILIKRKFILDLGKQEIRLMENSTNITGIGNENTQLACITQPTGTEKQSLTKFLETELTKFNQVKGVTTLTKHEIRLTKNTPIKQRHRPLNPAMQEIVNLELDRMLKEGVVEPSTSPWNNPIVMVRKKDNKYRFCIDFRKVNEVSMKDAYPLPFINSILDKLREARFISTLDLRSSYWLIPLTDNSKPITAFTVPGRGLYQFKVLPFGLHSAPSTFQRLLDQIISPEMTYAFAYLDDIVIVSKTFDEHLEHLKEVFQRLREANLQLNPDKCNFCRKELRYLGHLVCEEGIKTDPEKVKAILTIQSPKNVKQLRRFLGMSSWYRRFIQGYSEMAASLNKLLRKHTRWKWTPVEEGAFIKLKTSLTEAPVLNCPDFTKTFYLQTDASTEGLGIALTQKIDNQERVIAYASRSLSDTERKMSAVELECAAIVFGIRKHLHYLQGYHFVVITDHQSLKWLNSINSPSGRLARWIMELQQYDFEIRYRKGVLNKIADALSRQPLADTNTDTDDFILAIEDAENCAWYQDTIRLVTEKPEKKPEYCIKEGNLYRHVWTSNNFTDLEFSSPWKLCIPQSQRKQILFENHDAPCAGHLGIAKTITRISNKYYWPRMYRDIASYVRRCSSCQKYKQSQQQTAGKMQFPKINGCWDTVSIDIVGPLPRSSKGNTNLIVMQDRFTKWVECHPVRKATSGTVCKALKEKIISRFGCPNSIISDNGKQFVSNEFTHLLSEYGITHRTTTPYSPQCNPVERTNKVLKTMIAQYTEKDHRKWDQYLPEFTLAMNSSKHESTGFSPAMLNFGRELTLPSVLNKEQFSTNLPATDVPPDRVKNLQKLSDIFELVHLNLAKAYQSQSHHYNLRRRDWTPHVGDRVMKREHPLSSAIRGFNAKLAPKFSGPYIVERTISPVVVEIRSPTGRKLERVHVKDLKKAYA